MNLPEHGLRCPTCRAAQEWSDTCRRCKCDLQLLRQVHESRVTARQQALRAIQRGDYRAALSSAERLFTLDPDEPARQLVAVCRLLNGDFPGARAIAAQLVGS